MAKGKKITKEKFERIKIMLEAGVKRKKIMELEGVGEETVRRVYLAKTYEEYQENNRKEHIKYANRLAESDQCEKEHQEQMSICDPEKLILFDICNKIQEIGALVLELAKGGERT